MNSSIAPVARILLTAIFLVSGVRKIMAFAAVSAMMTKRGLPAPDVLLALSIVLDLAGGLMLIANWHVKYAAWALAAYTLVAGVLFHGFWDFWGASPGEFSNQLNHFLKNVGIIGGLLLLTGLPKTAAKRAEA
jgi:putative oxidoreductase